MVKGQIVLKGKNVLIFDSKQFLADHFIDAHGIVGLLMAYRLKSPTTDTARKWFSRGAVPSEWLPLLICALELDGGEAVSLAKYIKRDGKDG